MSRDRFFDEPYQSGTGIVTKPNIVKTKSIAVFNLGKPTLPAEREPLTVHLKCHASDLLKEEKRVIAHLSANEDRKRVVPQSLPDQTPYFNALRRDPLAEVLILDGDRAVTRHKDQIECIRDRHIVQNHIRIRGPLRRTDNHEIAPVSPRLQCRRVHSTLKGLPLVFPNGTQERRVQIPHTLAPLIVGGVCRRETRQRIERWQVKSRPDDRRGPAQAARPDERISGLTYVNGVGALVAGPCFQRPSFRFDGSTHTGTAP